MHKERYRELTLKERLKKQILKDEDIVNGNQQLHWLHVTSNKYLSTKTCTTIENSRYLELD